MRHLPTAAALALLLITAGVAGVVSADPTETNRTVTTDAVNETDRQPDVVLLDAATDRAIDARSVDRPSDAASFEERLAHRLAQFDLTDAQVREIVTEATRLRDDGASRLVIRSSIVMNLYAFGVDAPFLYAETADDRPGAHDRFHRFLAGLDVTPEQARELHAMVHRLHEAGASRGEIRQAVHRQLAAWDVDRPADDAVDRIVDRVTDRYALTDEQATEVERLIRGMLEAGAHRGEIREAVGRLLASYGIDGPPVDVDRRPAPAPRAPAAGASPR